ncbi:MAG: hypothetical protein WKF59_12380 [Chitinophagaceae bacterium]
MYWLLRVLRQSTELKLHKVNPQTGSVEMLIDRSTDDAYNDPGTPVTDKNKFGKYSVKLLNGSEIWMRGAGSSSKGDLPFLSSFDINTKKSTVLWRSDEPYYESVTDILDFDKMIIVTNRQSETEAPNYFIRDLKTNISECYYEFP